MTPDTSIHDFLRTCREAAKMTPAEAIDGSDITRSRLLNLEKSAQPTRDELAILLSHYLPELQHQKAALENALSSLSMLILQAQTILEEVE